MKSTKPAECRNMHSWYGFVSIYGIKAKKENQNIQLSTRTTWNVIKGTCLEIVLHYYFYNICLQELIDISIWYQSSISICPNDV